MPIVPLSAATALDRAQLVFSSAPQARAPTPVPRAAPQTVPASAPASDSSSEPAAEPPLRSNSRPNLRPNLIARVPSFRPRALSPVSTLLPPGSFPFSAASQSAPGSLPAGPAYDLTRPTACRGSRGRERPLLPRCAQSAPYIGREGKARVARAAARMAALGRWP